jgi:hypothetical protein
MTIHDLAKPKALQHWRGEHQGADRASLELNFTQLYGHGSTSTKK